MSTLDISKLSLQEANSTSPVQVPFRVGGKYNVLLQIGAGSFGTVYMASNDKNEMFAIKVDKRDVDHSTLKKENQIYNALKRGPGIARAYFCGCDRDQTYLVMELLGLSLAEVFERCNRKFSLKTILLLVDQMVDRLEYIHSKGIVHRDVKPANFLVGTDKTAGTIFLADFGLSEKFRDFLQAHVPKKTQSRIGTPVFASGNVHCRNTPSRRDDLESLAYMLILFYKGSLPWQNVTANKMARLWSKVAEIKFAVPITELCDGCPGEFRTFLSYCRRLDYDRKPNYKSIKKIFRKLAAKENIEYDFVYDWSNENVDRAAAPFSGIVAKARTSTE